MGLSGFANANWNHQDSLTGLAVSPLMLSHKNIYKASVSRFYVKSEKSLSARVSEEESGINMIATGNY